MEEPKRRKTADQYVPDDLIEQPPVLEEMRRQSFVSTSVVSEEPSIEQSKEWINTYLEGGHEEDDFQRKFFEGGFKVDPLSPNTQAIQILKDELQERILPHSTDYDKIIETYEEVITPSPASQVDRRKRTLDNMNDKEEPASTRTNKSIDHSKKKDQTDNNEKSLSQLASVIQGGEMNDHTINTPKSLPQMVSLQDLTESPISESNKVSDRVPVLRKQRSRSNQDLRTQSPSPEKGIIQASKMPTLQDPIVRVHPTIKIKIFDLSLVRERYMNKTDDEVRNNFLKTLQVKQKMPEIFSPKPHTKEQKSSCCTNLSHYIRLG